MALNSENVRVAVTGALYFRPTGGTAPATVVEAVAGDFRDVGYLSEDGLTEAYESDSESITAWQNATVVRTVTSSFAATLSFVMIETNRNSLELFHGAEVESDGSTGYKIDVGGAPSVRRSFLLDIVDGEEHLRIYIPSGQVTANEEITYGSSEAIGYGVTLTAYPVDGVVLTKYSDSAAWDAS